jgi:starch synthase
MASSIINTVNGSNVLTKNSARNVLPYVAASCVSVKNDESWIKPLKMNLLSPKEMNFEISGSQLKAHDKCFFDKESGLKISVMEGEKELIVAFGPLGSGNTEVDERRSRVLGNVQMISAVSNLAGFSINAYQEAAKFVEEFSRLERFKNKKIILVGQSLGGSLAQYAGLKSQFTTYCFNPVPLGRAQIKSVELCDDRNIHVISTEGDYATQIAENRISSLARCIVHTPTLFGKKYTIPSAYTGLVENHTYFMGSLMKYLGYDIRTRFEMIPPYELLIGNRNAEFLNAASQEIASIIQDLTQLKTILSGNDKNVAIEALKKLQSAHPFLFGYLSFLVWCANEHRDLGDPEYGSRRLLNTPFVLNKMLCQGFPVLDVLISHFHSILFLQEAKKTFVELPEKTKQLSQDLLNIPIISEMKQKLEGLFSNADNSKILEAKEIYEKSGQALKTLKEQLGMPVSFEEQKTTLAEISKNHPALYSSILRMLRNRFNPHLELSQVEQLLLVKPTLLLEKFGRNKDLLTDLRDSIAYLHPIRYAVEVLSILKSLFKHSPLPGDFGKLVDEIEQLEVSFSLANMQRTQLQGLHEAYESLKPSSAEATKASRLFEEISSEGFREDLKRVYMVCAECNGVIKRGGLAEAVLGVAEGLRSKGYEVTLIMPKYDVFPHDKNGKVKDSVKLTPYEIKHYFGNVEKTNSVFQGKINDINVLFIEDAEHFTLKGNDLYEIPGDASKIKANERFAYFGKSAAELIKMLRQQIDVVFFHDWHGALGIPMLARKSTDEWLNGEIPPLLYVFHNNGLAAQGEQYHELILDQLGLPRQNFNTAKEAISIADHVITVSEGYSREVQGREGNGLQKDMQKIAAQGKFTGITNGSNPAIWNPETQDQLKKWIDPVTKQPTPLNFGASSDVLESKKLVKGQLQKWLQVYRPDIIEKYGTDVTRDNVILYVGRFDASQKGLDKFRFAMRAAKEKGATFIVMGNQENGPEAEGLLNELEKEAQALKDPKQWGGAWIIRDTADLKIQNGADGVPGIGHLVRAAANINFCPSEYEPCGLTHLEGFAYGQFTVATNLGGYSDIICQDEENPFFNGLLFFRFDEWKSAEQEKAVYDQMAYAIDFWDRQSDEQKNELMSNLMKASKNYSWTSAPQGPSPADKYEQVMVAAKDASKMRGASQTIHPIFLNY